MTDAEESDAGRRATAGCHGSSISIGMRRLRAVRAGHGTSVGVDRRRPRTLLDLGRPGPPPSTLTDQFGEFVRFRSLARFIARSVLFGRRADRSVVIVRRAYVWL